MRIDVADTGRGISAEKMNRLFVPFERLGAEQTEIDGTGIGLALVPRHRRCAQRRAHRRKHRRAKAAPSRSSPAPSMPRATPPTQPRRRRRSITAPTARAHRMRTVLYIEDQDLNLRLVERILQAAHPSTGSSPPCKAASALDLAREHQPDLILLDLNLPDMSGDEVLRKLKDEPAVRHIPVIMVSADAMGDRVDQLLALGAPGYLTKPYKVADFLRMIAETLAGPEGQR